ncbi:MAG TPA: AarF/UbiB family protein [Bacteriovoracaceae bacterium]|nr:AarF/UbiB family protein [Bacteriovoracaceae bacterium]
MRDYSWIAETAVECKDYSQSLAAYFAKALSKVSFEPVSNAEMKRAWAILARDMVHYTLDPEFDLPPDLGETIDALQVMGIDKFNQEMVDEEKLIPILTEFFDKIFDTIIEHPDLFELLDQADILLDIASMVGKRFIPMFRLFPVFSSEALSIIPYLKEPLFTALYELPEGEHQKLTLLTERILHRFYSRGVRPNLVETLRGNLKGRNLLLPLIDESVNHLPADRCMTALISILCTPRCELSQGRIVSIVLQELGGMYVKLAQVLAELAPPSMAKELRHQQDKLGGIFGSQEKSWKYVLEILDRPAWKRIKNYIHIPDFTVNAFAGASVGAIYEFELTELGKRKLHSDTSILIKIQRPGLTDLFEQQKETLLDILNHLERSLPESELTPDEQEEVRGLITALKRTIINYATQSIGELDFRLEKKNADRIREALKGMFDLQIPQYFHVEPDVLMMEKIRGDKITSVVHSRYLERMSIADLVSDAYLYLLFQKGIIWADPHAGNILYDADKHQVKLIDLNPCFSWDDDTIKVFIGFLYRLILSDYKGIFESLNELIDNPDELKNERSQKLIKEFIIAGNQGAFIRYLTDFVRLLGEANINLRIEVQAALRGVSQVYLTATAISSRHNFGQVFQKQFGWKMLIRHILSIGPFKVARAALPIAFDLVKNSPEQEVGPTLDERDISAIEEALSVLHSENVCNIELIRNSPEENTNLTLATDGSQLIKSSHLRIEIQTETKPASVKYIVEVPTKDWLKERQEYVRLQGVGFTLCLVECLEQLRRHSLEDYWHVVENWGVSPAKRSWKESSLIGDVRLAARVLFSRRYNNIWVSDFMTVSSWHRFLWSLLIRFEEKFERREQGYFYLLSKKMGSEKVGQYTFGTLHRLKIISYRLIISGLKSLIKRSRFEMNLLPLSTDDLIHRMLHGLLRRGLAHTLRK